MQQFFRHFRPSWFNSHRGTIDTLPNGGISFMLCPVSEGTYQYWIYICPKNAQFSSKAAVKKLREVQQTGTMPWGELQLDDSPILNQLVTAAVKSELPTEVGSLICYIQQLNTLAVLEKQLTAPSTSVVTEYEAD